MTQLERVFTLRGNIVHGFQRGRQLGFPTANLDIHEDQFIVAEQDNLQRGVYIGICKRQGDSSVYLSVIGIGVVPCFDNQKVSYEVHILHDFKDEEFYDTELSVICTHHIRPQSKFESIQGLIDSINSDVSICRQIYKEIPEQLKTSEDILANDYFDQFLNFFRQLNTTHVKE
ncbi:hypothetical protein PCE1_003640 [Barthelona sp. PCE]